MPTSPTGRGEYCDGADASQRLDHATTQSAFFIIHEANSDGDARSFLKLQPKTDKAKALVVSRTRHSTDTKSKKSRSKIPFSALSLTSGAASKTSSKSAILQFASSAALPAVSEGDEGEKSISFTGQNPHDKHHGTKLLMLNRCGSAPDLPMQSPLSANVYSSFKKRTLQSSDFGSSPHLATLQRSRLSPLPANTSAKPVIEECSTPQSLFHLGDELDVVPLNVKDPLLLEKLRHDAHTISSLKQRLAILERENSTSTKNRYMTTKQITQLSIENQRLQSETTQQQARINSLDKTIVKARHEYDKLAARYAAVYTNLQKLADHQQDAMGNSTQQSILQGLARENQNFFRKLRVLEARHAEDKTLMSNQEKKIKRLQAEIEALQHMHEAKHRRVDVDEAASTTDQLSCLAKLKKRTVIESHHSGRQTSAMSVTSSIPRSLQSPHTVPAEDYQYIDPNILKVLEKVDSQFSITNAINLSVVLKKWLNSCVHVVCSTHLPTVLQALLKRACELLHCKHAALFTVDHATRKLIATCSERGPERYVLPLDKGISGYAVRYNVLCNVHCAHDDPRFYSSTDSITGTTSREVLAFPIVHELQLNLEAHGASSEDNQRAKANSLGVFAVLRAWNTTHQKPFSANDQILGCLLATQAGILLRQTLVVKRLQKINHKIHQILQMPSRIVSKASAPSHAPRGPSTTSSLCSVPTTKSTAAVPSVLQLVAVAQKELAECLTIKQLRIFILDAAIHKLWHVGEHLSPHSDAGSASANFRRYVSARATVCALLLRSDATPMILPEPSAEAAFNETVDLPGGARGMYLVPILSPWGNGALPFGMVQVPRVAKTFALTTSEAAGDSVVTGSVAEAVVNSEREAAQETEDRLMLELLGLFCRVFAGLLHHVTAQQLYDTCPQEIMQAQLALVSNHLDSLTARQASEDIRKDERHPETDQTPEPAIPQYLDHNMDSCQYASLVASNMSTPRSNRRTSPVASRHDALSSQTDVSRCGHGVFGESDAAKVDVSDALFPPQLNPVIVGVADAEANGDEDRDEKISSMLESELKDSEPLALEPEEHQVEDFASYHDMMMEPYSTAIAPVFLSDDWTANPEEYVYNASQYEEQCAGYGSAGVTWRESDSYDPTLWSEDVGTTWNYSVVEDAPEDVPSIGILRDDGSPISTHAVYATDLRLSDDTSSAETHEPSGAL